MAEPIHNRTLYILEPSIASSAVTLLVTGTILLVAYITVILHEGSLYQYFFGATASQTTLLSAHTEKIYNAIFKSVKVGELVDFGLCMLVGLFVYVILLQLRRGLGAIAEDLRELRYSNARPNRQIAYLGKRTIFRVVAIATWLLYWVIFIRVIFPFCLVGAKNLSNNPHLLNNWVYGLVGVGALLVAVHIHIILVRLISLRLRILGREEVR